MVVSLGQGLKRQFELQKFCDVTVTTSNPDSPDSSHSVGCHKVVLASSSKYFEHRLTDKGHVVIRIDVSPMNDGVLKEALTFLYNGECLIHRRNVYDLLKTAQTWVVPQLAAECCRYIINTRTIDNVCIFYEELRKLDQDDTSASLSYFIREHFKELHENKQIACLSLTSFNDIIAHDSFNVDSEDVVFASAEMVIQKNSGVVEKSELTRCWELIRFEFMSMTYLVDTVMYHELLRDAPQNKYVKQAVACNHTKMQGSKNRSARAWKDSESIQVKANTSPTHVYVAKGTLVYINSQNMVCSYNKRDNIWEESMAVPGWIDDTTVMSGYPSGLVVVGKKCNFVGRKVSLLDLQSRCEIKYPDLPEATHGCAVEYFIGTLYVIGGYGFSINSHFRWSWENKSDVWRISQTESTWTKCQIMVLH